MSALLIAAILSLSSQDAPLVSYPEAVRCAGLTQAASELEGGESARGRQLFDAALYWSLAAMQAARASNRNEAAAEAEQTRARITAVQQLNGDGQAAEAALAQCLRRTPDLG
jgi:hypothetical protein